MNNQDENPVVESAETTTEELHNNPSDYANDGNSEDEGTSETQSENERGSETSEQRQARLRRQVERAAKKEGVSVEEYLGKGQESREESREAGNSQKVEDEKYLRLKLDVEGVKSKDQQEVVLDYIREASLLGKEVDVETALNSVAVKEELAKMRRSESTPNPSNRTGGASNSAEYYARQIRSGKMRLNDVPDAAMRKQLTKMRIF